MLRLKKHLIKTSLPILFLLTICLSFLSTVSFTPILGFSNKENEVDEELRSISFIDFNRVLNHMYNFSNMGSRVTGYEGCNKAAEYIIQAFRDYGLKVETQKYGTAVPLDLGTTITIPSLNMAFEAYSLWPNGIQTSPTTNLEGKLIYIPGTRLEDFDDRDLRDSIILMDFNSGDNWIFAANMGAKAVIFIEPDQTYSHEAFNKRVDVPLYFPRIYVNKTVGEELKNLISSSPSDIYVVINSRMVWRDVEANNIIGIVEGKMQNDIIMVASYYDTWSIVPKKACSASDALGVSFLLELARYFSINTPERTIWFLAFSGHYQALAGVRECIKENFFKMEVQNGTRKLWMLISLGPFSWDTEEVQLLGTSFYSGAGEQIGTLTNRYDWVRRKIFDKYLLDGSLNNVIRDLTGKSPSILVQERLHNVMWWGSLQRPHILESEPVVMCGALGFSILSSPLNAYDMLFGIPLNDFDEISIEYLKPQFLIASAIIESFISERDWQLKWQDIVPNELYVTRWAYQTSGFITIKGEVVAFDYGRGWYRKIPNAIVQIYCAYIAYPFSVITVISDENGSFEVHGIPPFVINYQRSSWVATAFVLNESDGAIIYAPDIGIHGAANFALPISYGWRAYGATDIVPMNTPTKITLVVANLRSITLFDLLDLKFLRPFAQLDPRTRLKGPENWYVGTGGFIYPLDFETKSDLLTYSSYFNPWETVGLVFVPPFSKTSILIQRGGLQMPTEPLPLATIVNASVETPEGEGVKIWNEPLTIHFTAYNYVKDTYLISSHRYETLKTHNVRSLSVEKNLENASKYLQLAKTFYENKKYSRAYSYALLAASYTYRAYAETMSLIQDSSTTMISLFSLILISSLIMERLLINAMGVSRRLISIVMVTLLFSSLLYVFHPSFHIVTNSFMGVVGTLLWFIFGIAVIILASEAERIMRALSIKFLGRHTLEKGRIGAMMVAFSTSVGLVRKHPARTFLTLLTTFIISFSIISFTSTSPYIDVKSAPAPYTLTGTLYLAGIQIEKEYGNPPLGPLAEELAFALKQIFGDNFSVMPRYVYYPQSVWYYAPAVSLPVTSEKGETRVLAVVGLTPEESALILSKASIISSRSFGENDFNVCFLTKKQAEQLNATIGSIVNFSGYRLLVIGILETEVINNIKDLDGYMTGVSDPMYLSVIANAKAYPEVTGAGRAAPPRLGWDSVLIVPGKFAKSLGAYITTINIMPKSGGISHHILERLASEIATLLDANIWYIFEGSSGAQIYSVSRIQAYYVMGYQAILLIVILGSLNIAITIFASVRERTGEIRILALSGLSPRESMVMLLIESGVYIISGGVCGYLAGFALNKILTSIGALPPYFPFNYASMSVLYSIITIIFASFLGALFPSFTAAKMVTPSLKRKWELPTKPRGDLWEIPLPFRLPTKEAAIGLLFFLKEYFEKGGMIGRMYKIRSVGEVSIEKISLEMDVDHAPYELNVTSHVLIQASEVENNYVFNVYCRKLTGPRHMWVSSNYSFLDVLRKQFMLWGGLPESEKRKYFSFMRGA